MKDDVTRAGDVELDARCPVEAAVLVGRLRIDDEGLTEVVGGGDDAGGSARTLFDGGVVLIAQAGVEGDTG